MAAVLGILNRMDDAAVCAERAYRLRPQDVLANLQMGSIAFEQKRYREAVPYLQFVAQNDPLSYANPQLLLMRAYQEIEEPILALEQARRWLELHPDGELRPMVMKEYVLLKALAAQQRRHEPPS
jgi:tetratricopeptide (TPR) repeat protein